MKKLFGILQDLILFAGLALVSFGVYKIYAPAGIISAGLSMFVILFFSVGGKGDKTGKK